MGDEAIRNDDDLTAALKQIDALWLAERGSPEGDRLDALVDQVETYEDKHYPIPEVHGREASPTKHL